MNFNKEAVNWDDENRIKRTKITANEIANSIPIEQKQRAMEFGCGTGLISFNLMDKFEHITLVDISKGMIEQLNKKILDSKVQNMTALEMDINQGAALQDKFDVIYTSLALHHISDTKLTLENLYKLLSDEGYLCIVELVEDDGSFHKLVKDFNGHNGFNQEQLKKQLEETGFKNVTTNTFYHDIKMIEGNEVAYSLFIMIGEKYTTPL